MATDVFFFIQLIAACVFSPRDASLQHGGVGDRLRGPDCRGGRGFPSSSGTKFLLI